MSDIKKSLLAYKETLLKELEYYDRRILEFETNKPNYFEDPDSSDSDYEFPVLHDHGPSVPQLKQDQSRLKTCLQATEELTKVLIQQYEVNVLVDEPVFEGEPPVKKAGLWREVTAYCRVESVRFSITFYVHQPNDVMAGRSYRKLKVMALKASHEIELAKSVLSSITKPAEAVEVYRSYAAAHRSRRITLTRLADKFSGTLSIEPLPDGGYILKCVDLLQVCWSLQNKWSPLAPFLHRLKFDLEYMDESYIKIITQIHRELSDPAIDTEERTFLLSKIIATCLEAKGPTQELYESMSSDPETAQSLRKRRTTLEQDADTPVVRRKKDSEMMAPPKELPKKSKSKGKDNEASNRKSKRSGDDEAKEAKRARVEEMPKTSLDKSNSVASSKKSISKYKGVPIVNKNNEIASIVDKLERVVNKNNEISTRSSEKNNRDAKNIDNNKISKKKSNKIIKSKNSESVKTSNKTKNKNIIQKQDANKKNEKPSVDKDTNVANPKVTNNQIENKNKGDIENYNDNFNIDSTQKTNEVENNKDMAQKVKKKVVNSNNVNNNNKKNINTEKKSKDNKNKPEDNYIERVDKIVATTNKQTTNKVINSKNNAEKDTNSQKNLGNKKNNQAVKKRITSSEATAKNKEVTVEHNMGNPTKNVANNSEQTSNTNIQKSTNITEKTTINKVKEKSKLNKENMQIINKHIDNKESTIDKVMEKNKKDSNLKRNMYVVDKMTKNNVAITKKTKIFKHNTQVSGDSEPKDKNQKNNTYKLKNTESLKNKMASTITSANIMRPTKSGNLNRFSNAGNISKQTIFNTKKTISGSKNPIRISPRKSVMNFKPVSGGIKNIVKNKTTNIPRLVKKPAPKI